MVVENCKEFDDYDENCDEALVKKCFAQYGFEYIDKNYITQAIGQL